MQNAQIHHIQSAQQILFVLLAQQIQIAQDNLDYHTATKHVSSVY